MKAMRTIYTTRERPQWVAEAEEAGRIVMNAARPLWGHAVDDTWALPFIRGRHYAAIDPAGARAEEMIQHNERMDAARIVFLTEEEAFTRAVAWVEETRPKVWARLQAEGGPRDADRHLWIRSFLRHVNEEGKD